MSEQTPTCSGCGAPLRIDLSLRSCETTRCPGNLIERGLVSEQTPTADLTAILAEHRQNAVVETVGRTRVKCDGETCDFYVHHRSYWRAVELHDTHLAEQITAAGFGPVRAVEAKRDEWMITARDNYDLLVQAEAREKALRERITALADEWAKTPDYRAYYGDHARALLALLDASPDREDGAS